ncbi:MAG: glycosyltransferase [Spirochaetales bacterium]
MKVLFLSLTIGAGHNVVAKNIADKLDENGVETKIIKMYDEFKFQNWIFTKLGFELGKLFPRIYRTTYKVAKKRDTFFSKGLVSKLDPFLVNEINAFMPDVIVCTHVIGQIFMKQYGHKLNCDPKVYFIVTDYDVPPQIQDNNTNDFIIIPDSTFLPEMLKKGYREDQILDFGIPIHDKFTKPYDSNELKKQLGVKENLFTILVMNGGAGIGNIKRIINPLLNTKDDVQLIVVNGNNKKSYDAIEKIKEHTDKTILNIGFSKEIEKLMQVSDVLITKTGCITVNEALSKNLPICSIKNLQDPEYSNLEFLNKYNAVIKVNTYKELYSAIKNSNLTEIKENMKNIYKKDAATKIANHILNK